jgi:hypothetical protein
MTLKVSKEEFKVNGIMGIYEALALAQAEFESIDLDGTNPFYKSRYATIPSIRRAIQPALTKYGLAIIQPWDNLPNGDIVMHTMILHKSGEKIDSTCTIVRGNKNDQDFGKSITYMRRYQLCSVLGVAADKDEDDGEGERKADVDKKLEAEKERLEKRGFMDKKKVGELEFRLGYLPKEMLPKMLEIAQVKSLWDFSEAMYESAIKTLDKQIESLKVK